jgi:hypothetical protein
MRTYCGLRRVRKDSSNRVTRKMVNDALRSRLVKCDGAADIGPDTGTMVEGI